MKNRILTVVTIASLLSMFSGCGTMRNFFFGRGARCGICNTINQPRQPLFPRRQVPVPPASTYGPAVQTQIAPGCNICNQATPQMGCGVEAGCGHEMGCGIEAGCGHEVHSGTCNCGVANSYGPAISNYGPSVDPYLGGVSSGYIDGGTVSSGVVDGGVLHGGVVGEGIINSYPVDGTVLPEGNWYQRPELQQSFKVDQDGHRIISEEPLPPGATPVN